MSPTTVAGVAALLEHICGLQAACDSEFTKENLVAILGRTASMLRELAVQS